MIRACALAILFFCQSGLHAEPLPAASSPSAAADAPTGLKGDVPGFASANAETKDPATPGPEAYRIQQNGNNLELMTPYGKRILFGDYSTRNAREYKLEIPLDELRPRPKPQEPSPPPRDLTSEQALKIAEEAKKKAEQAQALVSKTTAPVLAPTPAIVEYDDSDRLVLEANHLYNRGKYYEASLAVELLLSKRPDFVRAWVMKGSLMYVQGQMDLAKVAWDQAIKLDPKNSEVKTFLGRLK